MPEFEVKVQSLQNISSRQAQLAGQLNECAAEAENILHGLTMQIRQRERIDSRLREMKTTMERQSRAVSNLARTGEAIAALYQKTEDENSQQSALEALGFQPGAFVPSTLDTIFGGNSNGKYSFFDFVKDKWGNLTPSQKNLLKDLTELGIISIIGSGGSYVALGSLIGATIDPNKFTGLKEFTKIDKSGEKSGEIFGFGYKATGNVQTWKYDSDWKTNNNTNLAESGNLSVGADGYRRGSLFDASGTLNFGNMSRNGDFSVGNAAVAGGLGATLFKDGKLAPGLHGNAKIEASAAQITIGGQNGADDDLNAHSTIKGWAGLVDAEANASLDENGLNLLAGAEACGLKGEVTGGYTIGGLKLDVTASGKYAAIGARAGLALNTNALTVDIGAAFGLGFGLKVKLDWSNFHPSSGTK